MGSKTKVQWADSSWSPVTGCTPVSAGCANCYAKRMAGRFAQLHGHESCGTTDSEHDIAPLPFSRIQFHPDRLDQPLHWRKPRRIFVCSMGDLFHPDVEAEWIHQIYGTIHDAPQHTYMILTKRPKNILWPKFPANLSLFNVWLGVSVEDQATANERIPVLLQIPAAKRFVSVEPMLGPVVPRGIIKGYCPTHDFPGGFCHGDCPDDIKLDWVVCGAETGPHKRRMELAWARSLRDQCAEAGVPFFFKRDSDGCETLDGAIHHNWPKEG